MSSDDKPLVAGRGSTGLWLVLIIAAMMLLVANGSIEEYLVVIIVGGFICGIVLLFRLRAFFRRQRDLLEKGESMDPFSYGGQTRKITYLIAATVFVFAAPIALSGFLDSAEWFGSLVGGIVGWLISLVAYNMILGTWQRRHGGVLYASQVWRGTKVTHTGLKFQRGNAS
jgi:hypothetical protein